MMRSSVGNLETQSSAIYPLPEVDKMSTLSSIQDSTEQTEIHRLTHEWNTTSSLEQSIIKLLTALENVPQDELPPLYPRLDVEAVEQVLLGRKNVPRQDVSVNFNYCGYDVTIDSQGMITAVEK